MDEQMIPMHDKTMSIISLYLFKIIELNGLVGLSPEVIV